MLLIFFVNIFFFFFLINFQYEKKCVNKENYSYNTDKEIQSEKVGVLCLSMIIISVILCIKLGTSLRSHHKRLQRNYTLNSLMEF